MNIEIEKKYIVGPEDIQRIDAEVPFLNEKIFVDTYFDDANYDLTKKDMWLRARGNAFELKVPLVQEGEKISDQYQEFNDPEHIKTQLGIKGEGSLEENLEKAGITPFCEIETTRKTYSTGKCEVTLDVTDFGYTIAEIEFPIEDASHASIATEQINELAHRLGLPEKPVRGKVIEFLRLYNQEHYNELIKSGTIRPEQIQELSH